MTARKAKQAGSPPLYEMIYTVLREHLAERSFPAGLVLNESVVARAFQSSRIPAAAALRRLRREGLVKDFDGRGFIAATSKGAPLVRLELAEAGLQLPVEVADDLKLRNRRERIYPDVEHTVAMCASYGRFLLNESALADHYGVSRTVAHEVLTRLERSGLITQDGNQRWYTEALTVDRLRQHFEMRWLLEPIALGQAMEVLNRDDVLVKRERAEKLPHGRQKPERLERLEHDLHADIVLRCHNPMLRETIQRIQLPMFATHSTFEAKYDASELETMVSEHVNIFSLILAKKKRDAMAALEAHVRRSLQPSIDRLERLGPLPEERRPSFLIPAPSSGRRS